jgi:hypothetical protein
MNGDPVARANEALRAKGYSEAQLVVVAAPLPGRALLKGNRIVSPFADAPETVLRVVEALVPPLDGLGRRTLTPRALREQLAATGGEA